MSTYADLDDDGHHELIVRVRNCSKAPQENRAFELDVEDIDGARFQFVVWEKSNAGREYDWQEGCWYRLSGVTANEWPSGTVPHGTSALEVEPLGQQHQGDQAELLYLTDSHLGKATHRYGGHSWSVTPEGGFRSAIDHALRADVDAVIHGGDLFHNPGDGITEEDITVCREELRRLAKGGIPFYFIYGNHEQQAGQRVLEAFTDNSLAEHLGPRYEMINDTLAVYGIDHRSDWREFVLDLERPPDGVTTMLCLHQSLAPFTESSDPDCRLRDLRDATDIPLDLVVTGHVHTRLESQTGTQLALSGGATTRVGESQADLRPSVEMVTLTDDQLNVERNYL